MNPIKYFRQIALSAAGMIAALIVVLYFSLNNPSNALAESGNPFAGGGLASTIILSSQRFRNTTTIPNQTERMSGTFRHPDSTNAVFAGPVVVNGDPIARRYSTNGTTGYHDSLVTPIAFNGSWYRFVIGGSTGFPSFTDSLQSPTARVSISQPLPSATVSKSVGFPITWNPATNATGGFVSVSDTSNAVGSRDVWVRFSGDPGAYAVTPTDLAPLLPGRITVRVATGTYKDKNVNTSQFYRLIVYSTEAIDLNLVP